MIPLLPKFEIPTEETLNDEDKQIINAFNIILNGYKRSQSRLQAISKAYIKLESIAQSLIKDGHENVKKSPKKQETFEHDKNTRRELSPLELNTNDSRDDILTVDLTYEFESQEQSSDNVTRASSPVFGNHRKKSKKNVSSNESELAKDLLQKNIKIEEKICTKKVANQEENTLIDEAEKGNEENRPPLKKTIFKSPKCLGNDSTSLLNESQTVAQIGFSKTIYNIDQHRTPSGKRSRQATLIFQPQTSKVNLSFSQKQVAKPNEFHDSLFDKNYRSTKKTTDKNFQENEQQSPEIFATDSTDNKSENCFSAKSKALDKAKNSVKNLAGGRKDSFIITTPSQIDETARSLFDDEDLEDFNDSEDLLNTCMDSPSIVENVVQPSTPNDLENRDKIVEPIASTSKSQSSHFSCAMDSIDETYFAPVEIEMSKKEIEKMAKSTLKAECSTAAEAKDSWDKNRNFKRKPADETQIEAAKELGDLEVQDIDWDQDITTDNWSQPKRPLNDSFDFLPEKKKNSPNFAHKGKVVRNQAERAKLRGWDCKDCEKYYGTMNLPEEELKNLMNRCSKHRSKYNPRYFTPKNFWNPVFPDATDSSDFSDDEPSNKYKRTT